MFWKYIWWRTWFIISMPWMRLRDFLSSCLKIFISESICFTKSWNSLVSFPCCTLWKQLTLVRCEWGGDEDRHTWHQVLQRRQLQAPMGELLPLLLLIGFARWERTLHLQIAIVWTSRQQNVICGMRKCWKANAKCGKEGIHLKIMMKLAWGVGCFRKTLFPKKNKATPPRTPLGHM